MAWPFSITRRHVGIALAAVTATAATAAVLRPAAIPVEVVTATRGALEVTLDEEGETRVRERFVVSAPVAGRVLRIQVEPGDPARANRTLLATLRPISGGQDNPAVELRSPVDGVVLRRLRESEAVVPQGEPLVEVGDPSRIEVVADYLSTDAVRIRPGQRATVERWGGAVLPATVRRVEPSGFTKVSALGVEEQRVNVIVAVDGDMAQGLGDRYRVDVRVVVASRADVVRVPVGALVRNGDGWAVFAVERGRASWRPIAVGERNEQQAEVRAGLAEGAAVVAFPDRAIADGTRISTGR